MPLTPTINEIHLHLAAIRMYEKGLHDYCKRKYQKMVLKCERSESKRIMTGLSTAWGRKSKEASIPGVR